MNKYFRDIKDPSINELIYWFMVEYTELVDDMQESYHAVTTNEPNPYHTGDNSIWTHTMLVCQRAEIFDVQKINKICALLHDIGKPMAREVIPFEAKKPIHSDLNELRKDSGMNRVMPKSGLKSHFRGHEGLSFYLAIEPLNRLKDLGVLTRKEVEQCLIIISKHGQLFNYITDDGEMRKPEKLFSHFISEEKIINYKTEVLENYTLLKREVEEYFKDEMFLFNALVTQVKCDSLGRFFSSSDGRKNKAFRLGTEIFTNAQFIEYIITKLRKPRKRVLQKAELMVLVGVPGSGKSSFLEILAQDGILDGYAVLSRDNVLMEYAKANEIIGKKIKCDNCNLNEEVIDYALDGVRKEDINLGKCQAKGCKDGYKIVENYSDVWKQLTDEDQKEIDKILEGTFKEAFDKKENMIIDMTNMSNKGQRKWVNKCGNKYRAKAIVFATGFKEVKRRLVKRRDETGKWINPTVINNMMKGFGMPVRTNFTEVEFVH